VEYFVDSIIMASRVSPDRATHFAIYNGNYVRYYIALSEGVGKSAGRRLAKNISAYSDKLGMLMKLLGIVPYRILQFAHIGAFVRLEVDGQIDEALDKVCQDVLKEDKIWSNVIVGSYVEKQKVVFQCFSKKPNKSSIYMKVGGFKVNDEMYAETAYLKNPIQSHLFTSPSLCFVEQIGDGKKYNIQVTEEFTGAKVEPKITPEIYEIFREISDSKKQVLPSGEMLAFSHGDFTPWNMKKENNKYIVFDWEYCGMRFYGFDLIHFLWQIENKLNKKTSREAIKMAIQNAKEIDIQLREMSDEWLEKEYFSTLEKQFGNNF
jgi:hypothetical protein